MVRTPLVTLTVALLLATSDVQAQDGSSVHPTPAPVARAARVTTEIALDGKLDESDWSLATPATQFRQREPNEGEPATQRTEVRFLVGPKALYIGARMYDDEGEDGVVSRLVRRDRFADADELTITFDPFHDHVSRTSFSVNPAGVRRDAYGPGGSFPDRSWDAVWEVETTIDSLGWVAEIRIPLSQLRYPPDSSQVWGIQIERQVTRLNEFSVWAFWGLNESGGPSRYGHLEAMELTRAPGRAELLPYVVGQSTSNPLVDQNNPFLNRHDLEYRVGADLKYLISSSLTLNATINPDFGQVEVDPAVVNLSAFETFFPERRPFFVQGGGFFRYGGFNCYFCSNVSSLGMFYTRRIGRRPQGAGNAFDAGDYTSIPDNSTILAAGKLTGRTSSGWAVGILDAMTRSERAPVMGSDGSRFDVEVEPFTNYLVGRVAKDLRDGNIQIGAMGTSVIRQLSDPALRSQLNRHSEAVGLETKIYWGQRTYRLQANVAFSQIAGDSAAILRAQESSARYFQRPDRQGGSNGLFTDRYDPSLTSMRGFAAYSRLSKESGNWLWELAVNARSPGFENNDIAFLTRADYVWMNGNIFRQFTKPTSWYRWLSLIVGGQQQYNFDGDLTSRQGQLFASIQPHNYWSIAAFYIRRQSVLDDRLTRGGPVVKRPSTDFWALFVNTDSRRKLVLGTGPSVGCNAEGACSYSANLDITFRPVSNISLSVGPSFNHSESTIQYVSAVDDVTATNFFGRRYVFGDLEQNSVSMNTRLNITFTPDLTLEVFLQPFISSQRYTNFKEYDQPRGLARSVYGRDRGTIARNPDGNYTIDPDGNGPAAPFDLANPDFNFRSLRGNAVLRWEYMPGSTLFLVWTQDRSSVASDGNLDFQRDMSALFGAQPENIFLVKVNYWLGI